MKFPVSVSEFQSVVPHRPPMVWVDEVTSASTEHGECRVFLKETALYYFSPGELLVTAGIEWIAQTYAYSRAAYFASKGKCHSDLKEAFLVAVRDAEFANQEEWSSVGGREIHIRVDGFRNLGPLTLINGQVREDSGVLLMKAHLRVFHSN